MANHRIDLSSSSLPTINADLLYITEAEYDVDWHSTPHIHPFLELFYITKGRGSFWIEGKIYTVHEDDVIFINTNVNHTEMSIDNEAFHYIALGISGINFDTLQETGFSIHNYENFKHEILYYLKSIINEGTEKEDHYKEIANKLLEILLINMIRRTNNLGLSHTESTRISLECAVVQQYIDRNYHMDITLKMMSELVHTSVFYLSHAFKEYTGMAVIDYLIETRIKESCNLLTTTNHSVSSISSMVGYSSPSYFSAAFTKRLGMSPIKYRKQNL